MKSYLLLVGVWALPGLLAAQTAVTDPGAAVPAVLYRSVFADTPTGVEKEAVDWKAANAEVGQFKNGHMDILKWEAAQPPAKSSAAKPMHHPMPAPAAPATGLPGVAKP